jgi:hypothetical protein
MHDDFRNILVDSSRKLADISASVVLDAPERIENIIDLMFSDEYPYSHRAARVFCLCAESFPELFEKNQNIIVTGIQKTVSEGVIRNILKIVADMPVRLSKKNRGILTALSFDWLTDVSRSVAVRVYAMQFLYRISLQEQDFKNELISILEEQYAEGSMGFRSRADKILKKLYKG